MANTDTVSTDTFYIQENKIILIAEDDEQIANFLMLAIAQETPYKTQTAQSGMDALRMAKEIKPDLFLLDYHLPSMTGIQLYDRLHAIEGLEKVPAIIMSANLPLYEVEKRHLIGLKKPFDLDELLDVIEQALG